MNRGSLLWLAFLVLLAAGTVGRAEFVPLDVLETFDGKESRYIEFVQLFRRGNEIDAIVMKKRSAYVPANADAETMSGTITKWVSESTAVRVFHSLTGARTLLVTFHMFNGKPTPMIEDIQETSLSTSIWFGKTIKKLFSESKERTHTLEFCWTD